MTVLRTAIAFSACLFAAGAQAGTLFTENFESGLGAWTGKSGGAFHAATVADPLNAGNKVLQFTALNSAGDIFTTATFSDPAGKYRVSFDYLGTCTSANCGGFIGYSYGLPDSHAWLGGTGSGYPDLLPDTGRWTHVDIEFTAGAGFHLMLEQFSGSTGPVGTAYFDNITLAPVPEPETYALFLAGLGVLGAAARRRRS